MDDEYLFKIALDATDFNAALEAMRSMLGQVQEAIGGSVRQFTAADNALAKLQATVGGANADMGKTAAITRESAAGFQELYDSLTEAANAYRTFREEQVVGNGVTNPHADVWAMSIQSLKEYIAISDAANASFVSEGKKRITAEQMLSKELAAEDQKRIDSKQRELAEYMAADRAIAESEVARINASAAALTAEVQARKKAAAEGATYLKGQTGPYDGLANSSARRTVGNAYTVTQSDGTTEADRLESERQLGLMREFYDAQNKENEAKRQGTDETRRQTDAFKAEAAARDRTNAALNRNVTGLQRTSTELPRLRYALYDISTTFTILGAGMTAYGAVIAKTTSDYQTSFASVARTSKNLSQGELADLKNSLIALSTEIPATFDDISKIATLGNQLNIPADALTGFTRTVTEFAAAANVSTDVAATAFGRLGQIFKTTDYQGLGDQIAYLGVRAVATEADIIKVTQQIAVSTNAYGISEKNTLALATAYASLGVKAESARGTTVRMLADLQKAVVQGGAPLAQIADVTGMSAAAFSKLFSNDANAGMTVFLQGLARYGRDSKNVLAELGITAQRDITNVGLLSQNWHILTDAQKNATQAGGALDEMFKKQTNTISYQLTLAGNKVQSILNDIGTSAGGPLRGAVDALNTILNVLDKITKDPVAATTLAISAGVITLGGTLLIGTGLAAQYAASILAVRTYMEAMGVQGNSLRGIFGAVTGTLGQGTKANIDYAESLRAAASEESLAAANAQALAASRRQLNVETTKAAVEQAELDLALAKESGVREVAILAELNLTKAVADYNLALAQSNLLEAEAGVQTVSWVGTLEQRTLATANLELATVRLTAAQDQAAIASRNVALANEEGALTDIARNSERAAGGASKLAGALGKAGMVGSVLALLPLIPVLYDGFHQIALQASGALQPVDALTSHILGLSNVASKQNLADLMKALPNKNQLDLASASWTNPLSQLLNSSSATPGQASYYDKNGRQQTINGTQAAANQLTLGERTPGGSVDLFHNGLQLNNQADVAVTQIQSFDQALAASVEKGDFKNAQKALDAYDKAMKDAGVGNDQAETALKATTQAMGLQKGETLATALASKAGTDAATKQARAFDTIVTAAFATGSSLNVAQKGMAALGASFEKNGAAATINGGALKTVIKQIYAETGGGIKAADQMQGLFNTLVRGGFASVQQLKPLADIIRQLAGGAKVVASTPDGVAEFYKAWNKEAEAANKAASKAAASAEAQSRTLQDYANDINSTISSMLAYQFGVGDAQDKITQTWSQIKQDAASAATSAHNIRTDLLALYATRASAQMAFAVDSAYGDVTATAKDRATLAKANDDIATKQKDLKNATDGASMSLVGNSDAAIKNRQTLEGQIGGYQAYIVALAQSGASQKEIDAAIARSKQEFIKHATQLGYNKTQVEKLATAFDGMRQVVDAIPRNITTGVTAKTSAAMKALADYRASIKQTQALSVYTPIKTYPVPKDPGVALGNSIMDGLRKTLGSQGAFDFVFQTPDGKKKKEGSLVLQANQATPSQSLKNKGLEGWDGKPYFGGGWTGNGGIYDPAGVVHGQEFVLNAIGAKMLPMADLVAMNQGRAPQSNASTVVIAGGGKSGGFTAQDKMFLAQVLGAKPAITLSADQFGKAIDGANVRANLRGAG